MHIVDAPFSNWHQQPYSSSLVHPNRQTHKVPRMLGHTLQSKTNLRNKIFGFRALNTSFVSFRGSMCLLCSHSRGWIYVRTYPHIIFPYIFFRRLLPVDVCFYLHRPNSVFSAQILFCGKILKKGEKVWSHSAFWWLRAPNAGTENMNATVSSGVHTQYLHTSEFSPISRLSSFCTTFDNAITGIISGSVWLIFFDGGHGPRAVWHIRSCCTASFFFLVRVRHKSCIFIRA